MATIQFSLSVILLSEYEVEDCLYHTDKKEKKIFLTHKEIQNGAVAKLFMRKGFLIYEKMRKYFPIYVETVSHI
jgi:hypothetical protein